MGRFSALKSNNILENSKEFKILEDTMLKLEKVISDCVSSKKVSDSRRNKLIELLESLSQLRFDVGQVDNLELLRFLKEPNNNYTLYEVVRFANGEINPKNYGYNRISLSK